MMQAIPYDVIRARIDALDLEPIKFKLAKENGYSAIQINLLEKWYKRFLFLAFKYQNQPIVVSELIDSFWHQHILDTHKYAEDCQVIFGEFLHHFPYFGLRGEEDRRALQDAYRDTLHLMVTEFQESPEEALRSMGGVSVNGLFEDVASSCSDCGKGWPDTYSQEWGDRPRLSDLHI